MFQVNFFIWFSSAGAQSDGNHARRWVPLLSSTVHAECSHIGLDSSEGFKKKKKSCLQPPPSWVKVKPLMTVRPFHRPIHPTSVFSSGDTFSHRLSTNLVLTFHPSVTRWPAPCTSGDFLKRGWAPLVPTHVLDVSVGRDLSLSFESRLQNAPSGPLTSPTSGWKVWWLSFVLQKCFWLYNRAAEAQVHLIKV